MDDLIDREAAIVRFEELCRVAQADADSRLRNDDGDGYSQAVARVAAYNAGIVTIRALPAVSCETCEWCPPCAKGELAGCAAYKLREATL